MFVEFSQTWEGANELCGSASSGRAVLTSIHSTEENDYVYSLFNYKSGLDAWLGGYLDSSGNWAWLDGSLFDVANWATGEPTGEAPLSIVMYGKTGAQPRAWTVEPPANKVIGSVCAHTP